MSAEDRDEVRELMVRHNPVLPHEVRRKMGRREEEVLRRVQADIQAVDASRRARRLGAALAAAALGVVTATVVSLQIPAAPRQEPSPARAVPPLSGRFGPRIPEDLARITRLSSTEPLRDSPPRPMTSFPRASPRLLELAALARGRPRPVPRPWNYVKTEEWLLATTVAPHGTTSRVVPWVVRRWTPVNGAGVYLRTRTPGRPFGDARRAESAARAGHPPPAPVRDTGPATDLWPRAAALSRSEPELRRRLLDSEPQTGMTPTRRLVRAVENLHSHDVVEPALSAALWRVLAAQDDLRELGRVRDRGGRPGEAFGFEDGPLLGVLVVSPATGDLLATELIRVGGAGASAGSPAVVEEYRTFVTGRWVEEAGKTS
ncbi:hypothetical protein GCM10017673_07460 [Streptosporangium violaceochromogenes]|nr:hypothetical protein GCM10017673_07460 [Streptosporangium violaceochromogenes]